MSKSGFEEFCEVEKAQISVRFEPKTHIEYECTKACEFLDITFSGALRRTPKLFGSEFYFFIKVYQDDWHQWWRITTGDHPSIKRVTDEETTGPDGYPLGYQVMMTSLTFNEVIASRNFNRASITTDNDGGSRKHVLDLFKQIIGVHGE